MTKPTMSAEAWADGPGMAAKITIRNATDIVYVVYVGESDTDHGAFLCINTTTNAIWWTDSTHLIALFGEDAFTPLSFLA